jgi:hypothetical protein
VRKLVFAKIGIVVALATLGAAAATAPRAAAPAATCVQATQPAWLDYADKWVRFRRLFFRPGLSVTLAHTSPAAQARRRGTQIAYWDMSLKAAVGTPSRPGDPARIPATAARLVSAAMKVTGCGTPIIALNELYGARLAASSSPTNAQYRANVLALVQALASHGAQPHLLISEGAATKGASADWWRSVASVATIVREVYISAPLLESLGPSGSTVYLRFQLRRAVRNFTTIGIPSSRVGLALGFHEGRGGRAGLSAARWYGVVKREALAVRQVASELALDSVWSWGWATFHGSRADPATADAACVYLWTRDAGLCDATAAAGRRFDTSRSQPAEEPGRGNARLRVLSPGRRAWLEVRAAAKLTARIGYVQEYAGGRWSSIHRVVLAPFHPLRMPVNLSRGRHILRLYMAAEDAPDGAAFWTSSLALRAR